MSISNKDKKPTATDRAIWEFLKNGGMVNTRIAYQHFGTARLSDNIYRLRNNGFKIPEGVPVYYKPGTNKHYFNFSLNPPNIIPKGKTVEKVPKGDGVPDFSRRLVKITDSIQLELPK